MFKKFAKNSPSKILVRMSKSGVRSGGSKEVKKILKFCSGLVVSERFRAGSGTKASTK